MVCVDCETLVAGEKVCVRVLGNPLPLAVGRAEIDGSAFAAEEGRPKGKAVTVYQLFGDLL